MASNLVSDFENLKNENDYYVENADINEDDDENEDADEDKDDDEDDDNEDELINCLFCEESATNIEAAFDHLQVAHKVNLKELKQKFKMDHHDIVKLIVCIRRENIKPEDLLNAKTAFWDDNKYSKPIIYERWLTYDYSDDEDAVGDSQESIEREHLKRIIVCYKYAFERSQVDMEKMRSTLQRITAPDDEEAEPWKKNVAPDEGYFNSYAHFSIHYEMLSDRVRTNTYREALMLNKDFVKGKNVLDIGCGTGVLSIFASQAGAEQVVAIDNSDILYHAMEIVNNNNIPNITLIKGKLEKTTLPCEKYDMIISEWMGYFLLYEGMLDSVIFAREKYLKPNGTLLPNRCNMSLLGFGDDSLFRKHVNFWDDVYGLNMRNIQKEALKEPLVDIVDAQYILTESEVIADFDLLTVQLDYSNFSYKFNLKCIKEGRLSAFVGYFDTFFDMPNAVNFSTGPRSTPTHWKQVVFFLEQSFDVKENDVISGVIKCERNRKHSRSLDITIEINGQKHNYYLD